MTPYATRLRLHLAESRHNGLPFEDAWRAALAANPAPTGCVTEDGWAPSTLAFAKAAFKDGYLRLAGCSDVGALAEREYARPSGVDPEPVDRTVQRRCGWGHGCKEPGDPFLCAVHGARIDAIRPYCHVRSCGTDATEGAYCRKHAHLGRAQQRAADLARGGKQAA